ncbi:hypothetical protein LCGC14_0378110 [marine sediment metagenome]|uniref:Uncharacterized protein n=1 Tax=marine sediment metagenome TaxID=412755 RepID=A0A0F9WBX2_9ZZZZ
MRTGRKPGCRVTDVDANDYSSSVISEYYLSPGSPEKLSSWLKQWLKTNDVILRKRNRLDKSCDRLRAAIDARRDMRDVDKQEKLDRRDTVIEAGDCSANYTGTSKDMCRGVGISGECFHCSGQIVRIETIS